MKGRKIIILVGGRGLRAYGAVELFTIMIKHKTRKHPFKLTSPVILYTLCGHTRPAIDTLDRSPWTVFVFGCRTIDNGAWRSCRRFFPVEAIAFQNVSYKARVFGLSANYHGFFMRAKWMGCFKTGCYLKESAEKAENNLPRKECATLNRIWTAYGRCGYFMHMWNVVPTPNCDCDYPFQTIPHILTECPIRKFTAYLKICSMRSRKL